MNLHALRIFNEVASLGSVTRAAEKLLLSQPAVTAQLRNLENEMGMKLITSNGRGVQLTEAGERLAARSNQLFSLEAEIEAEMQALQRGMIGALRIGATALPGSAILPNWIVKFKQKYPKVEIQLTKENSHSAVRRLLDHSIHIALICGEWDADEEIERFTIAVDELIFIVPRTHSLAGKEATLKDLMSEPFILREEGSYTRRRLLALCAAADISEPAGICMEGMEESIQAVKAGYGAALVPSLAVQEELASGELGKVNVQGIHIAHPIRLCTKAPISSPTAANFISWIKAEQKDKFPSL